MRLLIGCGYFIVIGIALFAVGRLLPKRWFDHTLFPYRAYAFERDGKLYEAIAIGKWQARVPDMSRILPNVMPQKRMTATDADTLLIMIRETCVAELTHVILSVLGLGVLYIMPGVGGAALYGAYFLLGNLPYIHIQRYNRPRLVRIYEKRRKKEKNDR